MLEGKLTEVYRVYVGQCKTPGYFYVGSTSRLQRRKLLPERRLGYCLLRGRLGQSGRGGPSF